MEWGEGGYIILINGTKQAWKKTEHYAYQLLDAKFPDRIDAGQTSNCYLQFNQTWGKTRTDTEGKIKYTLEGTNDELFIHIRDEPSRIMIQMNFETPNNVSGSWINVGWRHDGYVRFILSGKSGSYKSSNPPTDWMQANIKSLGNRPLSKICFPGTHNAGLSSITHDELIPTFILETFSLCQSSPVRGQLLDGARYFDIRPVIGSGDFYTGHYDMNGKRIDITSLQIHETLHIGARGQKISDIVNDINYFTEKNKELIILNISHDLNTDNKYTGLNSAEWQRLMTQLQKIKDLCMLTPAEAKSIKDLPLKRFIGSGSAAVLVIFEWTGITLPSPAPGFFTRNNLDVYNEYSNKDDCVFMIQDQLEKWDRKSKNGAVWNPDKQLFLLSWTLTPQLPDINKLPGSLQNYKSIRVNAYSANKALFEMILPECQGRLIPNVLYVDYLEGKDYSALAMAINDYYNP